LEKIVIKTLLRQQGHTGGSGAALARALGIPHSGPDTPRNCNQARFVINYGVSSDPRWRQRAIQYSNTPASVALCVNKLQTLQRLKAENVLCLEFVSAPRRGIPDNRVGNWIETDGKCVARTVLGGHSGQGIVICRDARNIPQAPLYTRYFKKDHEYRVHVAFGRVILVQQKKRNENYNGDDADRALVRTNDNGWTFCINDLDCDVRRYRAQLETLALNAAQAVGINHGAVDILVKLSRVGAPTSVVCEINTAPALRNPSTLNAYVLAFQAKLREIG
jgi:hypothetical protein